MAVLQGASDNIIFAPGLQNVKTMDKGQVRERPYLPIVLPLRRHYHDGSVFRVVRRVEFPGGQKLPVGSRHLHHGHNSAGAFPHRFFNLAVQADEVAIIHLLRRAEKMVFALIMEHGQRITPLQFTDNFFLYVHGYFLSSFFIIASGGPSDTVPLETPVELY